MSRFFAASDSDSSSESGDSEPEVRTTQKVATSSFMFSDDDEDTKRVVKSAKEKRNEQIHAIMKTIRNSKKIKDFNKMETSFGELCKAYDKAKAAILKEEGGNTPRFYVRILVEMEDFVNETWEDREYRKSMSKINSKSLGTLRQKLRKYIREDFDDDMAKFRENPDAEDDPEEEQNAEDEGAGSGDEDANDVRKSYSKSREGSESVDKSKFKSAIGDDDDSDDSYWDSDSDESDDSSSSDGGAQTLREKFLKKAGDGDEKKKDKKEKAREKRKKDQAAARADDSDDDLKGEDKWITIDRGTEKPKMFEKDAEINHDLVVDKLFEIMAARGKKRTNRKEQIELLTELMSISEEHNLDVAIYTKIQFAMTAAIFDYNPKMSSAMKPEYWEKCMPAIEKLLQYLLDNVNDLTTSDNISDDNESYAEKPYRIRGCFLSVVERMDEEFVKVLKGCDAHAHEYVTRLKDEPRVISILDNTQRLLELTNASASDLCRIYLKKIEHFYFKFDPKVIQQKKGEIDAKEETSLQVMDKLCKFIYSKDSTDRLRTQAILCQIYHHAIHDNWFEARDLMLMSHLQDSVSHADAATQILYNRTMVQLGLCGFRHAEIRDAHNALLDIQLVGRSKELLAQGLLPQRYHERSSEQEKIEKQRQMPFHMHINLEMLECVYLVSAMLIEIPYMAAHEFDARRRMISKAYYQQLRSSERQALVGPPESMREHVVAASKAMRNGDWKKCRDNIINEKMNAKVWDLFNEADKVRGMLSRKIQEESLRTYLFTYSKVYDSISTDTLTEMFELEKTTVHAIVSKMIINEELMASLDEPTECMVMHRTEPTRLQSLSLQLADKIAQLVENNERLLEFRSGGWQGNWKGDRRDGNQGGGGGWKRDGEGNQGGRGMFGRGDHHHRGDRRGGGHRGGGRGHYGGGNYGDKKQYDNSRNDHRGRGRWNNQNRE